MSQIRYRRNDRFAHQIKKLLQKYRTLEEDLQTAQRAAIELFHCDRIDNNAVELIPGFDSSAVKVYKLRKFACRALKGKGVRSGIRVVYAFYPTSFEVEFLEMYYKEKSDSDMDYAFIKAYFREATKS